MRIEWVPSRRKFGLGEIYLGIGLLVLGVARVFPLETASRFYGCPLLSFTGVPCLTCGFTRAFVYMANFDVLEAFSVSPLGASLFTVIFLYCMFAAVRFVAALPWPKLVLARREANFVRVGAVSVIAFNWGYIVFKHVVLESWG